VLAQLRGDMEDLLRCELIIEVAGLELDHSIAPILVVFPE
jgi:hypothetical protein